MFQIDCPHCGKRNQSEFRYGGEIVARPSGEDEREWAHYVYMRKNTFGLQTEWWYHRAGCQTWFKVVRNTQTNKVEETYLMGDAHGS